MKEGYNHVRVNHSINFVEPEPILVDDEEIPVHTQTIENFWGRLKAKLRKRRGLDRGNMAKYINEAHWLIDNKDNLIGSLSRLIRDMN